MRGNNPHMTTIIRCGKEIPCPFKKGDKIVIDGIDNVIIAVYDQISVWEITAIKEGE